MTNKKTKNEENKSDKKIKERIDKLKKENDEINERFQQIQDESKALIRHATENNGRIKELKELLK